MLILILSVMDFDFDSKKVLSLILIVHLLSVMDFVQLQVCEQPCLAIPNIAGSVAASLE